MVCAIELRTRSQTIYEESILYHKFLDTVNTGDFLRELRRNHKMTQKQFACFLGITLESYKKYEEGRCRLPLSVFEKIKNHFVKNAPVEKYQFGALFI